jgi:hypothetical protein
MVFKDRSHGFPPVAGEEGHIFFLDVRCEVLAALFFDKSDRFSNQQFPSSGSPIFFENSQLAADQ